MIAHDLFEAIISILFICHLVS